MLGPDWYGRQLFYEVIGVPNWHSSTARLKPELAPS